MLFKPKPLKKNSIFSCCTKSVDQPQKDLAKSQNPIPCWQTTKILSTKYGNFYKCGYLCEIKCE
jgi:hypothetical protein